MPEKKRVIALGFFDGVHLGHAALLRRTVQRALSLGVTSAVFTFDRPPKEVVSGIPRRTALTWCAAFTVFRKSLLPPSTVI